MFNSTLSSLLRSAPVFLCLLICSFDLIAENGIRIKHIGAHSLNQELELVVEPGDSSLLLTGLFSNRDSFILISSVIAPDGSLIYEATLTDDEENPVAVSGSLSDEIIGNQGEFAFYLPMHLQAGGALQIGTYRLKFLAEEDGQLENLTAIYKTELSTQQAIDLNFWVVDRNAQTRTKTLSADFARSLRQEADHLLLPHGMRLGNIQFIQANSQQTRRFADTDVESDIADLCNAMSEQFGSGRFLNVGFVETLSAQDISEIAGVSPASPGVILDSGAQQDCIAMSQRAYDDDIAMHATNLIHEFSHFMSLPHTTEESGLVHDKFDDTPECQLSIFDGRSNSGVPGNREGDEAVDDFECGLDGGAGNYLFYGGTEEFLPFTMSPQQAYVVKRHPLFYPAIGPSLSGSWYNPEESGHGLAVEVLPNFRVVAYWYTFDAQGNRAWMIGVGKPQGDRVVLDTGIVSGGQFPPEFIPENISEQSWGWMTLSFSTNGCNTATLEWITDHPDFTNSGTMPLKRLTALSQADCVSTTLVQQ